MDKQNCETLKAPSRASPPDAGAPTTCAVPASGPTPYLPAEFEQYPTSAALQCQHCQVPTTSGQTASGHPSPTGSGCVLPQQQRCGTPPLYITAASPQQPQQQQQQQPVVHVVVSSFPNDHVQSFAVHIVFACVVLWCCNCLFGFIALILAS